ncbi:MAG: ABC transporter permease [Pseudomonadota bacterium]
MRLERRSASSLGWQLLSPLIAVTLAMLTASALFAALGHAPLQVLELLFIAPVSDAYGLSELALKMTPLLLCATGLALCFRAGVWNIGAEGQYLAGCLVGGSVALALNSPDGPTVWYLCSAVVAGAAGGAVWAAAVALLRTRFHCSEVLTSIMLNYVALYLLLWAVGGPLKDPAGYSFPESALLEEAMLLPPLVQGYRAHVGFAASLLALAVLWTVVSRTLLGFKISVVGDSQAAARHAGFSEHRVVWTVLLSCGALAGLAGVMTVTGPVGQLTPHLSSGYGFTAIIVVFLGRFHPLGLLLAAALLALSFIGGENLQIELGLPKSIALMFQGLLLFFLLATELLTHYRLVPRE